MSSDASTFDRFPRSADLPVQSPLFWVSHKDRYLRQLLIRDIEARTERELIVYFTDVDNSDAQIDPGDDQFVLELLKGRRRASVDLLLETVGGFTDATEKVCSLLRQMAPDLRVVVPRKAKSNGTVVALAGQSIAMSATSELGPIDPSVIGIAAEFIAKDPVAYPASIVRTAETATRRTRKLATSLLQTGMLKDKESAQIDEIVSKLSSHECYASHGAAIDVVEAKSLGLKIEHFQPEDPLWEMFWLLRTMYAFDCPRNGYSKLFESSRISSAVADKPSKTT